MKKAERLDEERMGNIIVGIVACIFFFSCCAGCALGAAAMSILETMF